MNTYTTIDSKKSFLDNYNIYLEKVKGIHEQLKNIQPSDYSSLVSSDNRLIHFELIYESDITFSATKSESFNSSFYENFLKTVEIHRVKPFFNHSHSPRNRMSGDFFVHEYNAQWYELREEICLYSARGIFKKELGDLISRQNKFQALGSSHIPEDIFDLLIEEEVSDETFIRILKAYNR